MVMMSQCFHKYLSFFQMKVTIHLYLLNVLLHVWGSYYIHDRYNTLRNNLCILIFLHDIFYINFHYIIGPLPSTEDERASNNHGSLHPLMLEETTAEEMDEGSNTLPCFIITDEKHLQRIQVLELKVLQHKSRCQQGQGRAIC